MVTLRRESDRSAPRRLSRGLFQVGIRAVAVLLGAIVAYSERFEMNPDGVSYLDLGDASVHEGLAALANGYWSPLLPWLWGQLNRLLQPSAEWEYPLAHALIFSTYHLALLSFERMLGAALRVRHAGRRHHREGASDEWREPRWPWTMLGYAVCVWATVGMIGLRLVTPDMLMAALLFAAVTASLRLAHDPHAGWRPAVALGGALGLSYLAKAVMLPVGLVLLAATVLASPRPRVVLPRVLAAGTLLIVIGAPLVLALSLERGRLTTGDSGRLNHAWFVNHVPGAWDRYWPAAWDAFGTAAHPVRQLSERPAAFEFGTPIGGTYPVWYDPSYWYEGLDSRIRLESSVRRLVENLPATLRLLTWLGILILVLAIARVWTEVQARRMPRGMLAALRPYAPMLAPALAGIAMYAAVLTVPRYMGAFSVMLALGVVAAWSPDERGDAARVPLLRVVALATTVILVAPLAVWILRESFASAARHGPSSVRHWEVAAALHEAGLPPGTRVAVIGPGLQYASWARLARLRIVAEVPPSEANSFWTAQPVRRLEVLSVLQRAGARAVITRQRPTGATAAEWVPVGQTGLDVHWPSTPGAGRGPRVQGYADGHQGVAARLTRPSASHSTASAATTITIPAARNGPEPGVAP
jgi:hypothetical protein